MTVVIPSMTSLSLKQVLAMDLRGYQVTEKKDGVTSTREIGGQTIVGEQMRNGDFWAFDFVSQMPLRVRWQALQSFAGSGIKIIPCGHGVEFIEAIFAKPDSEGVVIKNWDSPFGYDWAKCKRVETFDVRVTDKFRGSVSIEFENQAAGRVALSGANLESVQVGQIIEIAAFKRNASGKFREPRFVRVRHDKSHLIR